MAVLEDEVASLLKADKEWQRAAKKLLREEMEYHELKYKDLMLLFEEAGTVMRLEVLQARFASANLSPAFFLRCLQVMNRRSKT